MDISFKGDTKLQAQIKARTNIKHTPCQCMYLLVTQSPACVDSAEACPPLSGHNVHRNAPPFDSEKQQALKMTPGNNPESDFLGFEYN